MSLAVTLSNALSGLAANQSALQVTSNNVANANTEGYARKTVELESRLLDGIGSGVSISGVNRAVDEFLLREVRRESGVLAERDVRNEFYARLQNLFGTLGDNSSIGASVTRFATAIETVATSPEVAAHRLEAVNTAAALARDLNDMANRIQELRGETNREISAAVDDINQQLRTIEELNAKITELKQTGRTTGELEDQRALAVDALAEYLPIQYFERSNGQMVVLTRTGQPLVESRASELGYAPAAVVTSAQEYIAPGDAGYPGLISGIYLNPSSPPDPIADSARDLTGLLDTGKLAGLIDMRDTALPDIAAQIDALAVQLRDQVNAIHNTGFAFPGPTQITGSLALPAGAATPISATGFVRIGTVDANGDMNTPRLDLDLGTVATAGDIVTAINGTAGLNISATIDGAGRLNLTSVSGDALVIADPEPPSALAPGAIDIAGSTRGFSHFFGLNNLFTGESELNSYAGDIVGSNTTSAAPGTLTIETAGGTFNAAYTAGMRLDEVAAAINGAVSAQGITARVRPVTGGVRLEVTGPAGQNILLNDSGALLQTLGVRPGVTDAARDITIRAELQQSPDLLSRGKLREEPAGSGNFHVGAADDASARALAESFNQAIAFGAVGGLPATTDTLAGFGIAITSFNASNAANASAEFAFQDSLHRDLLDKSLSFSGVNIDEEMANMVLYQNAYQASARLVQAADELFAILVNLGQ